MGFWSWLTGAESKDDAIQTEPVDCEKSATETQEEEAENSGLTQRPERKGWKRDLRINGAKLRNAIKERGMTCREVSCALGRSQSFVSTNCCDGFMAYVDLEAICKLINRDPNEFIFVGEPVDEAKGFMKIDAIMNDIASIKETLDVLLDAVKRHPDGGYRDEEVEELKRRLQEKEEQERNFVNKFKNLKIEIDKGRSNENKSPAEERQQGKYKNPPDYEDVKRFCEKLGPDMDVDEIFSRYGQGEWKTQNGYVMRNWTKALETIHAANMRKEWKRKPASESFVIGYFRNTWKLDEETAETEARKFVRFYEKHDWKTADGKHEPKSGWKFLADAWIRNSNDRVKGETA